LSIRSASLQARHGLLLLLAITGAIPYGCHAVLSLAVGGGIQVLNLAVLQRSVRVALAGQSGGLARVLMLSRLLLVLGTVALLLANRAVAPVPLLVGLSLLIPAAIWFGFDTAGKRA
jgi:ATP synthase I subunit